MSELIIKSNSSIGIWEDSNKIEEIRKLFAPTLTELEFQFFVGLGKATGLNPFTREIWSVKYDKNAPAQVFIGRDGYRKAAQAHSEYDFHQSDAVYENDGFKVFNGEVEHKYTLTDRGKLVGAYCVAKRHKSSRPMYVYVDVSEYSTGRSVWKDKPATMIKKVAESQCLRACFQDLLGGTYDEAEMSERGEVVKPRASEQLKSLLESKKALKTLSTTEQHDEIENLIHEKGFPQSRLEGALNHFKVTSIIELSEADANAFIAILKKEPGIQAQDIDPETGEVIDS